MAKRRSEEEWTRLEGELAETQRAWARAQLKIERAGRRVRETGDLREAARELGFKGERGDKIGDPDRVLRAYRLALTHQGSIDFDVPKLRERMFELLVAEPDPATGAPPSGAAVTDPVTSFATPLEPAAAVRAIARAFDFRSARACLAWLEKQRREARDLSGAGSLATDRQWIADLALPKRTELPG